MDKEKYKRAKTRVEELKGFCFFGRLGKKGEEKEERK